MILEGKYELDPKVDKDANELIKRLLEADPSKRGDYETIMNSPFIKDQ